MERTVLNALVASVLLGLGGTVWAQETCTTVGSTQTGAPCPRCGTEVRTCEGRPGLPGIWSDWVCTGQLDCNPGDRGDEQRCGRCNSGMRAKVCGSDCRWPLAWGPCENETGCRPGLDSQERTCGDCDEITQRVTCDETCRYPAWEECPVDCWLGQERWPSCGKCGTRHEYCSSLNCRWYTDGPCQNEVTGAGSCAPTESQSRPCACGDVETQECDRSTCLWGAWSGCKSACQEFYVRDWTNSATDHDSGAEPSTDLRYWDRCDVWTRQSNTQGTFPGGQPENEEAIAGGVNYAFTRVHRNTAAAAGTPPMAVTAKFFFYNLGIGSNWEPLVGSETLSFGAADPVKVSPGLQWSPPVGVSGKKCLAVQISASGDEYKPPSLEGSSFGGIVEDNNKAQRNIHVIPAPTPSPSPVPAPPPPPGGMGVHFVVHNPGLVKRLMILEFSVAAEALRQLVNPRVEVVGGQKTRLLPQGLLTLPDMQPGENRWIRLSVDAVRGERPVPVSFSEPRRPRRRQTEGGVTLVFQPTAVSAVATRNLRLHQAAFARADTFLKLAGAPRQRWDSRELVGKPADMARYRQLLDSWVQPSSDLLGAISKGAGTDPLQLKETLAFVRSQLRSKDDVALTMAHASWLDGVDAALTRLQLAEGDSADIPQNVRWQIGLLHRIGSLGNKLYAAKIEERSSDFLRSYAKGSLTARDYPKHVELILPELQALAAEAPTLNLTADLDNMRQALSSPVALQKAHRGFLLKLQSLDEPSKP